MTPARSPRPSWRARAAVVCFALACLTTAGCAGLPGLGSDAATPAAPAPSAAPPAPGAAAPVDPPATQSGGAPLAGAQSVDLGGQYGGGRLTFSVVDLAVRGRLTVLRLQMQADGITGDGESIFGLMSAAGNTNVFAPELLDPVHLKAYAEAEGGLNGAEGLITKLVPDRPTTLTFNYAAPQDDVTAFDVVLGSGLPTFRDVPLSR